MKRKQFGVIGLGRFGSAMAMTLTELGHDVIGVDGDESRVQQLADVITHALQIDATDEKALRAAGIQDVDVAVVSIGENIESSLLVVMQLRDLGIGTIVAKAVTPLHGRILEKLGVSRVIFPEREMAIRIAHSLVLPNLEAAGAEAEAGTHTDRHQASVRRQQRSRHEHRARRG